MEEVPAVPAVQEVDMAVVGRKDWTRVLLVIDWVVWLEEKGLKWM